jgi:multicomponent Na+:H+ antiporter subunit G
MSAVLDAFSVVCIVAGAFFFAAGTIGLLRFPDAMTRLHALTKADNLGLGLVVLGLLPHAGSVAGGIKLILVWLLVMFGSAVVSQLIARVARSAATQAESGSSPREPAA